MRILHHNTFHLNTVIRQATCIERLSLEKPTARSDKFNQDQQQKESTPPCTKHNMTRDLKSYSHAHAGGDQSHSTIHSKALGSID